MINKQNLWFLTLFSLILVLSVYYITMPNDLLLTNNSASIEKSNDEKTSASAESTTNEKDKTNEVESDTSKGATVTIKESETLEALRVSLNQEREAEKTKLQSLLTNSSASSEEKNNAYEKLQEINTVTSEEASLEQKLKEKYKMSTFVKIENNEITVVVDNDKHDTALANNIMRSVQENFKEKMYITVQFK